MTNVIKLNKTSDINLPSLLNSRLLIQANSGGGKSWVLRRILEQSHGKVQQIVIDLEGEFSTLREKYDYILAGKEGDTPADPKTAGLLAHKLLELNVSAIIDLYELHPNQRKLFVKNFLDAMVNAPKKLWHDCIVVIDEAHIFAPEKGNSEALDAVIGLCPLGRKRGFCPILATQRLSKLHKDAAAECNNKLIGRTNLDVDLKRASDELGFNSKEQGQSLRKLEAGEFFMYGPAMSRDVEKVKVGDVITSHPSGGNRVYRGVTPPTDKIKKVLGALADLPEEARQQLKTEDDLRKEVTRLRTELTIAKKDQGTPSPEIIAQAVKKAELDKERQFEAEMDGMIKATNSYLRIIAEIGKTIAPILDQQEIKIETRGKAIPAKDFNLDRFKSNPVILKSHDPKTKPINTWNVSSPQIPVDQDEKPLTGGALRMVEVLTSNYPMKFTKSQLGAFSKMKPTSGTFGTYISTLRNRGYLSEEGNHISASEYALSEFGGNAEPKTTEEVIEMWRSNLKGGTLRIFETLVENPSLRISRETLGEITGLSHTSGSFGTYLSILRSNGLASINSEGVQLSENLQ